MSNHWRPFGVCALGALVAAAVGGVSRVEAVVIAYEGFNYPAGPIHDLDGGTGWTGPWVNDTIAAATPGIGEILETGMTYTDSAGNSLVVSGNRAFVSGMSGAAGQVGRTLDPVGDDPEGDGGVTTWWSFIGQRLAPHPTDDENLIRAASLQLHDVAFFSPSERLAVGKGTTAADPGPVQTNWSMLHSATAGNAVYSDSPHLQKAFLVVRIDHVGPYGETFTPDSAWLWVNPRLDVEPVKAEADAMFLAEEVFQDFAFDRIRTFTGATNTAGPWAEFDFDEIRLGTTYADVAPFTTGSVDNANFDGQNGVNGNDFLIWQRGVGLTGAQATPANGNANSDTVINNGDLAVWKGQYGPSIVTAVPEPTGGVLAAVALMGAAVRRRR